MVERFWNEEAYLSLKFLHISLLRTTGDFLVNPRKSADPQDRLEIGEPRTSQAVPQGFGQAAESVLKTCPTQSGTVGPCAAKQHRFRHFGPHNPSQCKGWGWQDGWTLQCLSDGLRPSSIRFRFFCGNVKWSFACRIHRKMNECRGGIRTFYPTPVLVSGSQPTSQSTPKNGKHGVQSAPLWAENDPQASLCDAHTAIPQWLTGSFPLECHST
jgi:hypothetical protein